VLVAAFVARGLCADLFAPVLSDFDWVVPEVVAEELRRVLLTPRAFTTLVRGSSL